MTCATDTLTHERLQEILHYDPVTGIFTWKIRPAQRTFAGDRAGALSGKGYRQVRYKRKFYRCNRLAWFYMTGGWPKAQIDHKNGDRADDSWNNLREATNGQNQWNTPAKINNKTGLKGARWNRRLQRFTADIRVNGKTRHIGVFDTAEDAHQAYLLRAAQMHGEFFHPD